MPAPVEGCDNEMTHSVEWVDVDKCVWRIELSPQRIVLRRENNLVELPSDSWARDLYVTQHGTGYLVRIETFEFAIRFVLTPDQMAPLLAAMTEQPSPSITANVPAASDDEPERKKPLLWPSVSPLAVWALICSSLVFVPVIGLMPAVATVVLLVSHRARVRRTRANSHSRALCVAAFVFLVTGLCISVLATIGTIVNFSAVFETIEVGTGSPGVAPIHESSAVQPTEVLAGADSALAGRSTPLNGGREHYRRPSILGQNFWEGDHNWGMIAAGLLVIILSLSVHECGHAITAWWLGDDFARRAGRVTLKPMAHIDPFGTVLLPLILFMVGAGVFGWAKPVPVRTENLRRPRRDHILISLAGPGSNLLLASASLALMLGLGCIVSLAVPSAEVTNFAIPAFTNPVTASGFPLAFLFGPVCTILQLSFLLNVFLACFNLIPVPPLDGSWVLEHLFPRTIGPIYAKIRPFGFLLFLALIYTDMLVYLLIPAFLMVLPGIGLLGVSTGFV